MWEIFGPVHTFTASTPPTAEQATTILENLGPVDRTMFDGQYREEMDVRHTVLADGTMSNTEWLIRNPDLATQWAVKMADAYHKVKGDRSQMVFLGDQTVASLPQTF